MALVCMGKEGGRVEKVFVQLFGITLLCQSHAQVTSAFFKSVPIMKKSPCLKMNLLLPVFLTGCSST